ncbi:tyrosine-protein phosphatase vhp-1 [Conger conger]|uniref:tyrosine-protein phosphatase vhp-1 n=1 Tax=Conger conger TaxID=82655 RepID=UPI002A5AAA65|nr:tyrosine-protein phosphatase vhp-1 [Conger conger]
MVFYRDRESDRQPISLILPHLYLGAEADVTQDGLSSQGISYVLSVSRCCPQPSFLPQSQYFRIPIDDSLRDELLPWIPQALQFIDGALSLGCSVLVHCAAGISRSPALTVAYVMYHLRLDLDQAYRFVKERRPSISPNFNFLGQLQCFQGTLTQKSNSDNQNAQPVEAEDSRLQCTNEDVCKSSASTNQDTEIPVAMDNHFTEEIKRRSGHITDYTCLDALDVHTRKAPALTLNLKQEKQCLSELLLNDQIRTLSLNQRERSGPTRAEIQTQNSVKNGQTRPVPKPTQLQIPSGTAALSDKRKTLTLSLTPLDTRSEARKDSLDKDLNSTSQPQGLPDGSRSVQERAMEAPGSTKGGRRSSQPNVLSLPSGRPPRGTCRPRAEKTQGGSSRAQRKEGRGSVLRPASPHGGDNSALSPDRKSPGTSGGTKRETQRWCSSSGHHQGAPDRHCATAVEAVEGLDGKQLPLSPLNLTVSKLFDWGGRILMGALLGPRVKIAQPALPYPC